MSISGKLAVVTGGGSGIGRAICNVFARNGFRCVVADVTLDAAKKTIEALEHGKNVISLTGMCMHEKCSKVVDRTHKITHKVVRILLANDGKHSAVEVDVTSGSSVASLFVKVKELHSRTANVVVNCAGITRDGFLLEMSESQFDQVINVNLKGTFLVTKQGAQEMIAAQIPGAIVNISSIIGKTGNIGQTNYAASKAGVVGFTKSAAQELAKFNIRCNSVLPGFIDTPMIATVPEKIMTKLEGSIPLRRKGTPDEVAEVVHFLASDNSSYMTGGVIEVTGGLFM